MGNNFHGSTDWVETVPFTLSDDPWGMDELTRTYEGPTSTLAQFLALYKKLAPDSEFPQLGLTHKQASNSGISGAWSQTKLTFRGLLDDDIPDPIIKGGFERETSQIGIVVGANLPGSFATDGLIDIAMGNNGGGLGQQGLNTQQRYIDNGNILTSLQALADAEESEISVTYNSPSTTFQYVTKTEPLAPKYSGVLLMTTGDFEVTDMRPAVFSGRPAANREIRTVMFDKARAGNYWEVTEKTQGILTSVRVALRAIIGKFQTSGDVPQKFQIA